LFIILLFEEDFKSIFEGSSILMGLFDFNFSEITGDFDLDFDLDFDGNFSTIFNFLFF